MAEIQKKTKSPWTWIPTLYFAQGIPYVVVATTFALIMYKRLGLSNTDAALFTSWLYLPWVIKPFWSPFVDILKTKRWWITTMQLLIGAGFASIAFILPTSIYIQGSLALFWLIGFSSATHDIAADGFYMLALDSGQQSFFVGIRSTFYRLAMISGQGLLVILAGSLETFTGLSPLEFTVQSSNNIQSDFQLTNQQLKIPETDKMTFVAFPDKLVLNTNNISRDSLETIKTLVQKHNIDNGFVIVDVADDKKNKVSWWNKNISTPLGNFIRTNFGEKRENLIGTDGKTGNAGVVAIRLSRKPEANQTVVLNSTLKSGDKSINLISGERIVFNDKNWDKPAYILIQLDYKLNSETFSKFKGTSGNIRLAWSITFFIIAGLFLLLYVYHKFILPHPNVDVFSESRTAKDIFIEFGKTFTTFFSKSNFGIALAFMLLYRLGEAMLVKMASPFMLDSKELGGLGLTTGEVGLVYGTVGIVALTLGGIIGGIAASRRGLKFWIWPMALAITLPNIAYVLMALYTPENMLLVNIAVAIEQFGYGFGFTAYMLYLIYFADGEHKTAHYAICTGFMALGMMLPGMIAGWLQELIGYSHFFIFVMLCAIPTLAVIPFLKIDKKFGIKNKNN